MHKPAATGRGGGGAKREEARLQAGQLAAFPGRKAVADPGQALSDTAAQSLLGGGDGRALVCCITLPSALLSLGGN